MKEPKMNLLNTIAYIFVTAVLFTAPAFAKVAREGGQGSGGGNIRPATPVQIKAAIKEVWALDESFEKSAVLAAFKELGVWQKEISDPAIRSMLPAVFGVEKALSTYPVAKILSRIKIDIKDTGPCLHQGLEKASSIESNTLGDLSTLEAFDQYEPDRNATICFSVKKFDGIPKYALKDLIVALSAHELMHLLKFEEPEAIRMEQFFLDNKALITSDPIYTAARFGVNESSIERGNVSDLVERKGTDLTICLAIGEMTKAVQGTSNAIVKAVLAKKRDRPFVIEVGAVKVGQELMVIAESTKGYCGISSWRISPGTLSAAKYAPVPLSNRAALNSRLQEMKPIIEQLKQMTGSHLYLYN